MIELTYTVDYEHVLLEQQQNNYSGRGGGRHRGTLERL